ncbi:lipopolysaccharide heptosyltransferase I [Betaproteobacteria bacterium GR16-43]|nr:lipopolysaccharide heptosyltransferase I [Betaproteobacteria bacterium GR16-43]
MAATRVLFVKLSSLGDVIHHMPAVTDLCARRPDARIHWAVEEAYADLVRLHPAVEQAIAVPLRRVRGRLGTREAWRELGAARRALRRHPYDYVVDTQGLLKSALVSTMANGAKFGFDRASAREGLAARFYDQGLRVARAQHAVERNRQLVAEVFGYNVDTLPDYGIAAPPSPPAWAPPRYYVALHASSRADKLWPDDRWVELARRLSERGLVAVYPGGSALERNAAARLASLSPGGLLAPPMSLVEAAALLSAADGVVGVDTGLTHLAVALDVPTLGLYVATDPALTGLHGGPGAVNLGGPGRVPTVDEVEAAMGYGPAPDTSAE